MRGLLCVMIATIHGSLKSWLWTSSRRKLSSVGSLQLSNLYISISSNSSFAPSRNSGPNFSHFNNILRAHQPALRARQLLAQQWHAVQLYFTISKHHLDYLDAQDIVRGSAPRWNKAIALALQRQMLHSAQGRTASYKRRAHLSCVKKIWTRSSSANGKQGPAKWEYSRTWMFVPELLQALLSLCTRIFCKLHFCFSFI